MNFTREELQSLNLEQGNPVDFEEIAQTLLGKVFANEELSLAEEQFVCGIIENLRNDKAERNLNLHDYCSCKNYLFRNRYLLYFNDLNGYNKIVNHRGEIPLERKQVDIAFLQKEYEDWSSFIVNKLNGNLLINYVAQESKFQLNALDKYCERMHVGANRKEYLKKSLVLHGKYIYLLVKEFYQELGKDYEVIEMNEQKILIDGFTYVHTMFRHFSEQIKEHQAGKSYHFDENIGFKEIPSFLQKAIRCFVNLPESKEFDFKNLNFIFNGSKYSIWFRPFAKYLKGSKKIDYHRVQTFYPIENQVDLEKIKNHLEVKTNCGFNFLIKITQS